MDFSRMLVCIADHVINMFDVSSGIDRVFVQLGRLVNNGVLTLLVPPSYTTLDMYLQKSILEHLVDEFTIQS